MRALVPSAVDELPEGYVSVPQSGTIREKKAHKVAAFAAYAVCVDSAWHGGRVEGGGGAHDSASIRGIE